jgi:hypothetical protein
MRKDREIQLKKYSKKEVFEIYVRQCLGRVHNAVCSEQVKSYMIEDILNSEFGRNK